MEATDTAIVDVRMHLDKANVLGVLTEALAADVQAILSDQAPLVRADPAAHTMDINLPILNSNTVIAMLWALLFKESALKAVADFKLVQPIWL